MNEVSEPVDRTIRMNSHFTVPTDEKFALAGVDFVPGERIKFDLLYSERI
jgi:hypothetical protein